MTGASVRPGNTVDLLPAGKESYEKRWELIEAAGRLHMVSFSFMRDDTTRRLADLVRDKVAEGVEVKLIVDDAALYTTFSRGILRRWRTRGSRCSPTTARCDTPRAGGNGHPLRRAVRNAKLAIKRRFHEKFLVVDGREAVLGGMNWGTKYALGRHRRQVVAGHRRASDGAGRGRRAAAVHQRPLRLPGPADRGRARPTVGLDAGGASSRPGPRTPAFLGDRRPARLAGAGHPPATPHPLRRPQAVGRAAAPAHERDACN